MGNALSWSKPLILVRQDRPTRGSTGWKNHRRFPVGRWQQSSPRQNINDKRTAPAEQSFSCFAEFSVRHPARPLPPCHREEGNR